MHRTENSIQMNRITFLAELSKHFTEYTAMGYLIQPVHFSSIPYSSHPSSYILFSIKYFQTETIYLRLG